MNDPKVQALYYRVGHDDTIDYAKAPPVEHFEPNFRIRIADGKAEVEPIVTYRSIDEARAAVEPFLRMWEVKATLERGPGELTFAYQCAEVIDRNPTDARAVLAGIGSVGVGVTAVLHVSRGQYPPPPSGMKCDSLVQRMFSKYLMYQMDSTTLPDAANYCLTALEKPYEKSGKSKRKAAAHHNSIEKKVLDKLGQLAASKGELDARKFHDPPSPFTRAERHWLESLLRLLIRRAAERASNATASLPLITMNDLPIL